MTTDHTSESSWEADTVPAGQKSFVTPAFDVAAEIGPEPEQEPEREPLIESASALGQDLELDQDLECEPDAADGAESVTESLRESLQSGGVDAIEFRVSRPGTPVRRLRLTGNRYTFGSAEGCSIRLTDRDLRPMHAVLIREASRTLVRAYSVPVDVNGTRITEAELHPGDVLSLGAYRFELLDDEEASARRSQSASEDARPWRSIFEASQSRPLGSFSFAGNQLGLGAGLSSSEDVIWKERLKREMEQWRERQVECDRRENRCEEREAKLRDRETELWSRAEDLSRRESHLQSQESTTFQLDEAEARLKQLAAQLELLQDDRGSDLAAQQEQLAESERSAKELRLQVQELQQGLSEATEESARLRVDYEEAFASVVQLESIIAQGSQSSDKDRETWEAEADELRASVERLSLELGKANRELDELRDANVQLTARLDDMQRQRDEARADAEARPTPESFESLQEELAYTSDELTQARSDYEGSLQQLSEVQRDRERDQEQAAQALADALALAEANREANRQENHATPPTASNVAATDALDSNDFFDQPSEVSHDFVIEQQESEAADPGDDLSGSLANRLIRDLDEESRVAGQSSEEHSFEEPFESGLDEVAERTSDWDQEHGEDSIEAYMNRLLRRVQGQPLEDVSKAAPLPTSKDEADDETAGGKKLKEGRDSIDPNTPYIARSQAPEKSTSMSAMRELANTSARVAISRSTRVRTRDTQLKGMFSLTCAFGAVVCGIACYFFIPGIMRYLAVAMTAVVALIYVREGWHLFQEASRQLKAAEQGPVDPAAATEANDADRAE